MGLRIPGDQRHGNGKDGHMMAAQQVVRDGILLFDDAPKIQADHHGQTKHNGERHVLGNPA